MIDQRFFTKSQPLSLEEIAQKVGAITIFPEGSKVRPDFLMEDITAMGEASDKSITFLHNPRYKNNLVHHYLYCQLYLNYWHILFNYLYF